MFFTNCVKGANVNKQFLQIEAVASLCRKAKKDKNNKLIEQITELYNKPNTNNNKEIALEPDKAEKVVNLI